MDERYKKLIGLRNLLNTGNKNLSLLNEFEGYFLGSVTGCKCKITKTISALNQFMATTGNDEIIKYETPQI